MARKQRIDFDGAWHHVMNRGADHQATFRNDLDRELLVNLLGKASSRFGIEIHAFVFMGNHYHLLVRSPSSQLSRTLQFIARSYTKQFNQFHDRDGALFRGRFHSVLVDSDTYLNRLSRYIARNPVESNICDVESLGSYRWSSYPSVIGFAERLPWLHTTRVLEDFSSPADYARFGSDEGSDGELVDFYSRPMNSAVALGGDAFVNRVQAKLDCEVKLEPGLPSTSLNMIEATVLDTTGATRDSLNSPESGRRSLEAKVAMLLATELTSASMAQLAERYGFRSVSTVASTLARLRARSPDSDVARLRENVLMRLHHGNPSYPLAA
jgi:putative transposase